MNDRNERWAAVGEAIQSALAVLPESQNAVAKRIGISANKFRQMRDGKPGNYRRDTLVKVSLGLWGDPNVLDRILAGEHPADTPARRSMIQRDWPEAAALMKESMDLARQATGVEERAVASGVEVGELQDLVKEHLRVTVSSSVAFLELATLAVAEGVELTEDEKALVEGCEALLLALDPAILDPDDHALAASEPGTDPSPAPTDEGHRRKPPAVDPDDIA